MKEMGNTVFKSFSLWYTDSERCGVLSSKEVSLAMLPLIEKCFGLSIMVVGIDGD